MRAWELAPLSETAPSDTPGAHRYLSFYRLQAPPFRASADPGMLWLGKAQRAALTTLTAAIRDGDGLFLLTGDIGTGKTSLANRLSEELGEAGMLVGSVRRPGLDSLDFLQAVLAAFNMAREIHTRTDFVVAFQELLDRAGSADRKVLLVVDEAQGLSPQLLREIRDLPALQIAGRHRLAVLLVGHTELGAKLSKDPQAAARQRIAAACSLAPLSPDEVASYIRHALATAGSDDEVFSAPAVGEIASLSRGAPGAINIICDRALLMGAARGARPITPSIIQDCCRTPASPGQESARLRRTRKPVRRLTPIRGGRIRSHRSRPRLGLALGLLATGLLVIGAQFLSPSWLAWLWHDSTGRSSAHPSGPSSEPDNAAAEKVAQAAEATEARVPPADPALRAQERALEELPASPAAPADASPVEAKPTLSTRVKRAKATDASYRDSSARREAGATPAFPQADVSERPSPNDRPRETRAEAPDPSAVIDWLVRESSPGRR